MKTRLITAAVAGSLLVHMASAQKNSGQLLPVTPPVVSPPAYRVPPVAPPPMQSPNVDSQVEAMVQTLPLDLATRELSNREPPDIRDVERRLNLRETHGFRTDLRSHRPSSREIVDALAGR